MSERAVSICDNICKYVNVVVANAKVALFQAPACWFEPVIFFPGSLATSSYGSPEHLTSSSSQ